MCRECPSIDCDNLTENVLNSMYFVSMIMIHLAETVVNDPAQQNNARTLLLKRLDVHKWRDYHSVWVHTMGTYLSRLADSNKPSSAAVDFIKALSGHVYHHYTNNYSDDNPIDRTPFLFGQTQASSFERDPSDFEEFLNALVAFFEANQERWNYTRLKWNLNMWLTNLQFVRYPTAYPWEDTMNNLYPGMYDLEKTDFRWSTDAALTNRLVNRLRNLPIYDVDFDLVTGPGAKEYIRSVLIAWYDFIMADDA